MSQIQEDYEKVLRPYLASADAYQPLAKFVQSVKNVQDLLACMSRYFLVTKDNGPKETRSLSAFYDLSAAILSKGTVYDGLRYETLAQKSDTLWHDRYAALNEKSRSKLDKQIKSLKANLTPTQRMFLSMFEAHMKKPDDKKIGDWLGKLKFPPLYDCLRAYIEVSQQYKDTAKDSLKIFYAMSFLALGKGGNVFASQYETWIKSEGSVWKRRYDALEWWQKEKYIDPAIVEGKKITTTTEYKLKAGRKYEGEHFDLPASDKDPDETIAVTQKQTIDLKAPKADAQPADQLRK
ncbi:MAG TPA: hypothetical protein VFD75_07770, partial [Pyrinomonadaceae bacterium]|nr:hypothetical protein [Pyrinomonadaceae bacterium]